MPHPLEGGPAFRVCAETILVKVRWQYQVAERGFPLIARVGLVEGNSGIYDSYQRELKEWADVEWGAKYLAELARDEAEVRAIMLRSRP